MLGGWNVFGLDPTSMFWVTVEWRTENCWARNNLLFWFFFGQNNYCRWHDSKCSPWKHHSNHADLIKSQVHLPQSTITAPLDSYDLEILQTHIMMMTMTTMQMVLTCLPPSLEPCLQLLQAIQCALKRIHRVERGDSLPTLTFSVLKGQMLGLFRFLLLRSS